MATVLRPSIVGFPEGVLVLGHTLVSHYNRSKATHIPKYGILHFQNELKTKDSPYHETSLWSNKPMCDLMMTLSIFMYTGLG